MNIDIFRDLNLYETHMSTLTNIDINNNIICEYKLDTSCAAIKKGDIVSFLDNNTITIATNNLNINAIAIENSKNNKVKCQIYGIAQLNDLETASVYYIAQNGKLTTLKEENNIEIGKAISNTELLLKDIFIC